MSLIWVGYMGPADVDTKDFARRRFKLSEVVPLEKLVEVAEIYRVDRASGFTAADRIGRLGDLELEVSTTLVTENTNGTTCANAWVGMPALETRGATSRLDREPEPNLEPETCSPRRRLSAAFLLGVAGLLIGLVGFAAGAHWGTSNESRKWSREVREWWIHRLERDLEPRVQGRGELWLRCPSSTTWYGYTSVDVALQRLETADAAGP